MQKNILLTSVITFLWVIFAPTPVQASEVVCDDPNALFGVWDYQTNIPHVVTVGKELKTGWDHKVKAELNASVKDFKTTNVKFQFGNDPRWVDATFVRDGITYRLDHRPSLDTNCSRVYSNVSWVDNQGTPHHCSLIADAVRVKTGATTLPLGGLVLAGGENTFGALLRTHREISFTIDEGVCPNYSLKLPDGSEYPFAGALICTDTLPGTTTYLKYFNNPEYRITLNGDTGKISNYSDDFAFEVMEKNEGVVCGKPRQYFGSTKVFGYVKDDTTGKGIQGAKVSVAYKQDMFATGYQNAPDAVSDTTGYWETSIPYASLYHLMINQTNADVCSADGRQPDVPAEAAVVDANDVRWTNPPQNVGGITFYDTNCQSSTAICGVVGEQADSRWQGPALVGSYTAVYGSDPQYGVLSVSKDAWVKKVEVVGLLDRDVAVGNKVMTCRLASAEAGVIAETLPNPGPFTKTAGSWLAMEFASPVEIKAGTTYQLACKVNNLAGGGYIYWKRGPLPLQKSYRLYGCAR